MLQLFTVRCHQLKYALITTLPAQANTIKDYITNARLKEPQQIFTNPSLSYDLLVQDCLINPISKLPQSKLVHSHIIQSQFRCQRREENTSLWNKLLTIYAKCGNLADARRVFDQMREGRDVVSWTAMISAYATHGHAHEALALFRQMKLTGVEPNHFTFSSVLPACAALGSLELVKQIHVEVIRSGFLPEVFVANALVDMYAKCAIVKDSRQVFDKMTQRDVVSWNAMVSGYAENGCMEEALGIFGEMSHRNVVSWTSMIAGYVQNGLPMKALKLFRRMQWTGVEPNSITFASILSACANLGTLDQGIEIHGDIIRRGFEPDASMGTSLVDMYAKCGSIKRARNVFDKMTERNVVSWTAMIGGYTQNGYFEEGLLLFREMQQLGMKGNPRTLVVVLPSCAHFAALEQGMEIHEEIIRSGYQSDVFIGNALVDMYAKCGSLESACTVFNKMTQRDAVSWTVMIAGYAFHGYAKEALELFEQMQQSGADPNHITFLAVLTACCHAGLLDEGQQYFIYMTECCHIEPTMEHYGCMVGLLGRAGRLTEAENFITRMPMKPDVAVWGSLLGACAIHNNVEVGERVAVRLFQLDPKNSIPHVVLSNLYVAVSRWDDIERVRKMMKDRKVRKKPGCSWIELNKTMYAFVIGNKFHRRTHKINENLDVISANEDGNLCA